MIFFFPVQNSFFLFLLVLLHTKHNLECEVEYLSFDISMRSFRFFSEQFYSQPSSAVQSVMAALDPKKVPLSTLSCKMMLSLQDVFSTNFKLTCRLTLPELKIQIIL